MQDITRQRTKWLLIGAGWTVFGLFFAGNLLINRAYFGRPLKPFETIGIWLLCAYLWLGATPLILVIARRFPLTPIAWKPVAVHLISGVVISSLLLALYVLITVSLGIESINRSFSHNIRLQLIGFLHTELLTYWAVIGLRETIDYYQKYREREVRASQLETQLVRAQLDVLRTQLQPHFLFNTLNTISVLMEEDVARANDVLLRLSDLLRVSLKDTERLEVSLREELEFLTSYLAIEQTRFQNRLSVKLEVSPDTLDAQVPNLILQPLVENAIRHAVAPRPGKSKVEIRATRQNGTLKLQVTDDGPGLVGDIGSVKGIGLKNTQTRLDKLYGSTHSFSLLPVPGGGLQVTLTFPFHTVIANRSGDGENSHVVG